MSKTSRDDESYDEALPRLQLALVKMQQRALAEGEKVLVIFEGRDAAGKDGTIRRVTEHMSVRATRVVALSKPSDIERTQWYFQRYVSHLPAGGQFVIFNRSWYNRAGVEKVMAFSTPAEQEDFLREAPLFEEMLVGSGIRLVKFWMDVSKSEQAERLAERENDPLKVMKTSPLDAFAQPKWDDYSAARDEMLRRTDTALAPWVCVKADQKKAARLNVIRHLVNTLAPPAVAKDVEAPDPDVLFRFEIAATTDGRLCD
ncbi:MAG: polyphosphate kinase 2 [Phenylobacterium sp.]|uniref:polyphosphate kinase 2 n=1 Tax=Phenylobacterium sp. TaxID=1871053 RepID=UPI00271B43A1|nr:polyphosphate kinase 2 [Phenylobacterium sp.]MDO8902822.1 polyphosphate kinase 2 [Phenylobacterium sp.]MDP2214143.1 polyphosphate kinase 2 [Phenylobacterium sp.]